MKAQTIVAAAFAGAVAALGGGVALAARKPAEDKPDEEGTFALTVKDGDTLSALALALYGDAQFGWVLGGRTRRPLKAASDLRAGDKIDIQCVWTTIRKGETLPAVAKRTLGDQNKWGRIRFANAAAIPDPNKVQAGQRVAVPTPPPPPEKATEKPDAVGGGLELLGAA